LHLACGTGRWQGKMSIHSSICIPVCLYVCIFVCLSICMSNGLSVHANVSSSIYLSVYPIISLFICLSEWQCVRLSFHPYVCACLSVCLFIYLQSICLPVHSWVHHSICPSIQPSVYLSQKYRKVCGSFHCLIIMFAH